MVHPTAIIHPDARVDATVEVGPYVVIDAHVVIGSHCRLGPHVHITGHTTIGSNNVFHAGGVIGDAPQDLKYRDEPTRLRIGDHNVFREHVTIHRSNKLSEDTVVGSNNLLMANSHLGHNVHLGNHVVIANGALIGGHAQIGDRAFISGNCLVHQFTRIGTLAMMQGGAGVSQDLPPFTIAHWQNTICGLNTIGLRRAGLSSEERLELRRLYHLLFRSGENLRAAVAKAQAEVLFPSSRVLLDFITSAKRGVCRDMGAANTPAGEEEQ